MLNCAPEVGTDREYCGQGGSIDGCAAGCKAARSSPECGFSVPQNAVLTVASALLAAEYFHLRRKPLYQIPIVEGLVVGCIATDPCKRISVLSTHFAEFPQDLPETILETVARHQNFDKAFAPTGHLTDKEFHQCFEEQNKRRRMLFKGVDANKGKRYQ